MLQDLMSDAMEETDSLQSHTLQSNGQLPLIHITMYLHQDSVEFHQCPIFIWIHSQVEVEIFILLVIYL